MKILYKKRYLLIILFLFFVSSPILAQQNHFIYLQTENKQPFYILINKKNYSSSTAGYVIIPKLTDSLYKLTLGFPKNEWPEQNFTCKINKSNIGFIIKNFEDKGWGLFNWQTMEVVMAETSQTANSVTATSIKSEDTIINPIQEIKALNKNEEKIITQQEVQKITPILNDTDIIKLLSTNSAEGMEMVYIDKVKGNKDTIRLIIPAETDSLVIEGKIIAEDNVKIISKEVINTDKNKIDVDTAVSMKEKIIEPSLLIDTSNKIKNTVYKEKEINTPIKPMLQNSDCKINATEQDFLKLNKKMAVEKKDEDMINMAKKTFKVKCFSTHQIKKLSILFLTDESKYKFFDAAYPFVSDSFNFSSLESELTDSYFINRFKVMIHH